MALGPDGNLWIPMEILDPESYEISEFNLTTRTFAGESTLPAGFRFNGESQFGSLYSAPGSILNAIVAGPDGNLWFTDSQGNGAIGRINPTTDAITEFPIPRGAEPVGITAGPDGNLWFTESGGIGTINPTTGDVSDAFIIPGVLDALPNVIVAGPDGRLWFTDVAVTDDSGGPAQAIGVVTLPLVVTVQPPSNVSVGQAFTVMVQDLSDPHFSGLITISMGDNPGGATLGGTTQA